MVIDSRIDAFLLVTSVLLSAATWLYAFYRIVVRTVQGNPPWRATGSNYVQEMAKERPLIALVTLTFVSFGLAVVALLI